jgi:hypothetical protein
LQSDPGLPSTGQRPWVSALCGVCWRSWPPSPSMAKVRQVLAAPPQI